MMDTTSIRDARAKVFEARLEKQETGEGLIFASRSNTRINDMALTKSLRDNKAMRDTSGRIANAHGFRSGFRDWASENGDPRDVAQCALAHTVKNAVEAACHRTGLLEQRRTMMLEWQRYRLALAAAV